jgi:outer membrane scaffolding protein for murein synthesis (MipA/OmpV family)
VPLYLYEGEYLFAHGTKFGLHVINNDTFVLNIGARYQFNQLDPDPDDPFYNAIDVRQQTWEAGIEVAWRGGFGILQAGWWTDTQSRHSGQVADLTWRYRFDFGKWMVSPYLTARWLDSDFTRYYYGVSEEEARPDRPAYLPGDAVNLEWGVNTWYQFNPKVFAFANLGVTTLDSTIQASPLVTEESAAAVFVGAGFLFGGENTNVYQDGENPNPWSWRVSYGYQAQNNIFPKVMAGMIESSNVADTNIGGLTVGKMFQGGERVEMWGKFAMYRHFEDPLQDNFWSYNAYMQLLGKGYSPWSEQLLFRWGFGLGVSYAQEIPIVEQIKQERKGEKTNRLLNYLEFQVDFPLERLFKSKHVRDCFVGMTVAHRSGIFATSDILGSVNGGADWVTFHYECVR